LALSAFEIYPTHESQLSLFVTLLKGAIQNSSVQKVLLKNESENNGLQVGTAGHAADGAEKRDRDWPDPAILTLKTGLVCQHKRWIPYRHGHWCGKGS